MSPLGIPMADTSTAITVKPPPQWLSTYHFLDDERIKKPFIVNAGRRQRSDCRELTEDKWTNIFAEDEEDVFCVGG